LVLVDPLYLVYLLILLVPLVQQPPHLRLPLLVLGNLSVPEVLELQQYLVVLEILEVLLVLVDLHLLLNL
jgi:hypothetical protein